MTNQKILRFSNDNVIRRQQLKVVGMFIKPDKEPKVWLNFREYFEQLKGFKALGLFADKSFYLPIDDRDCLPQSPYYSPSKTELKTRTDRDRLAEESLNYEFGEVEKRGQTFWFAKPLQITAIMLASCLAFILIMAAAQRINLSQIWQNFSQGW